MLLGWQSALRDAYWVCRCVSINLKVGWSANMQSLRKQVPWRCHFTPQGTDSGPEAPLHRPFWAISFVLIPQCFSKSTSFRNHLRLLFFLNFQLEDNCFTMLHWFLPYINVNQRYVCVYIYIYIYIHICACIHIYVPTLLKPSPTRHPISPLQVDQEHQVIQQTPTGSQFYVW